MCRFDSDRRYSKKLHESKSREEVAALSRFSLRHVLRLIQAFKLAGLDGLIVPLTAQVRLWLDLGENIRHNCLWCGVSCGWTADHNALQPRRQRDLPGVFRQCSGCSGTTDNAKTDIGC